MGRGRTVIYLDDGLVIRVYVGERGGGTPCRIPISYAKHKTAKARSVLPPRLARKRGTHRQDIGMRRLTGVIIPGLVDPSVEERTSRV